MSGLRAASAALLRWYVDMGADEALSATPLNRFRKDPPHPEPGTQPGAADPAASAKTLEELRAAVESFEGCALRSTANRTVFADGNPESDLMLIGEAPGVDEDREGLPFVGRAGKLVDRMLSAIGRDRTNTYITNVVFWRPPNNRAPTEEELASCLPFVRAHVALVRPRAVLLLGASAARSLLGSGTGGISTIRGQWRELRIGDLPPVPTLPTFHPAYLLRQPARKAEAWNDLRSLRRRLEAP